LEDIDRDDDEPPFRRSPASNILFLNGQGQFSYRLSRRRRRNVILVRPRFPWPGIHLLRSKRYLLDPLQTIRKSSKASGFLHVSDVRSLASSMLEMFHLLMDSSYPN
jgi:hypothetical protein